jgi:putative ABC transport system substrate-binding protein
MNRPAGNVTGATFLSTSLEGKRLELLHELIPTATVIALLVDTNSLLAKVHGGMGRLQPAPQEHGSST